MHISLILSKISPKEFIGDPDIDIKDIISLSPEFMRPDVLSWCSDKNIQQLQVIKTGTIICSDKIKEQNINPGCNYIIVANPRAAFRQVLELFSHTLLQNDGELISSKAIIHPTAVIGNNVQVGHNVVIERDCIVGNNSVIGHNTVILARTRIGDNVKVGMNNTIGGVGFGYEKGENLQYELMPHLGNVVIKDNVDIGNNTCIDRAVLGSTILNENVKVDNLVHIAHGVVIGENSLIIANAMIGGSTVIGKNCWVAPSSSLINKLEIGDSSVIGMGAVVVKKVLDGQIIVGNPGKPLIK